MKKIIMFTIALITMCFILLGVPAGVVWEALRQGFSSGRTWFRIFSDNIRKKGIIKTSVESAPAK